MKIKILNKYTSGLLALLSLLIGYYQNQGNTLAEFSYKILVAISTISTVVLLILVFVLCIFTFLISSKKNDVSKFEILSLDKAGSYKKTMEKNKFYVPIECLFFLMCSYFHYCWQNNYLSFLLVTYSFLAFLTFAFIKSIISNYELPIKE